MRRCKKKSGMKTNSKGEMGAVTSFALRTKGPTALINGPLGSMCLRGIGRSRKEKWAGR